MARSVSIDSMINRAHQHARPLELGTVIGFLLPPGRTESSRPHEAAGAA
jgi:hypothetical protein